MRALTIAALLCSSESACAQSSRLTLDVWPGRTVGDSGNIGPERVREPAEAPTRDSKWITNVTRPTITVYSPPKEINTGVAMVICPGGGYWNLAIDLEGEEVAERFCKAGITGIVLKYRVPRRPGQPEPLPAPGPVLDVQRAISLVRSKAESWGIDPARIGVIGFSAGGHLAITAGTQFDKRAYEPVDDVDKRSCRPDFVAAIYPGYLANKQSGSLESSIAIPKRPPPMLLIHASDDTVAGPVHSIVMYQALRKAGAAAEIHVYSQGEHGFGVRPKTLAGSTWPDRCLEWLKSLGLLPARPRS